MRRRLYDAVVVEGRCIPIKARGGRRALKKGGKASIDRIPEKMGEWDSGKLKMQLGAKKGPILAVTSI